MSADINLLPTDLRSRERKLKAEQAKQKAAAPVFSHPHEKAVAPAGGQALSWWQKLVASVRHLFTPVAAPPAAAPAADKIIKPVVATKPPLAASPPLVSPVRPEKQPALPQSQLADDTDIKVSSPPPAPAKLTSPVVSAAEKHPKPTPPPPLAPPPAQPTPPALGQLDVNLIPLGQRLQPAGPAKRFVILVWLTSLAVLLIGYGIILFYQQQKLAAGQQLQAELINSQQQLELLQQESEQALALGVKLQTVTQLFDKRITWLPLFSFLEKHTVPAVYFFALAADSGGKLTLSGQGTNYTEVMRQLLAFEQAPEVAQVEVSNLQQIKSVSGEPGVSFSFVLTVKPLLFELPSVVGQ